MTIVKRETLDRKLYVKAEENKAEDSELSMALSMVDPPSLNFFCLAFRHVPPASF